MKPKAFIEFRQIIIRSKIAFSCLKLVPQPQLHRLQRAGAAVGHLEPIPRPILLPGKIALLQRGDGPVAQLCDHIPLLQPCKGCAAAGLHGGDQNAPGQIHPLGGGGRVRPQDAKAGPPRHLSVLDQGSGDGPGLVDADGKALPLHPIDGDPVCIDAQNLAPLVQQGAAGVSAVDGGVGLDQVHQRGAHGQAPVDAGNNAEGHAAPAILRAAAHGDGSLSRLHGAELCRLQGSQAVGADLQNGKAAAFVAAHDKGRIGLAPVQGDGDAVAALQKAAPGEHIAVFRKDDAAAAAALPGGIILGPDGGHKGPGLLHRAGNIGHIDAAALLQKALALADLRLRGAGILRGQIAPCFRPGAAGREALPRGELVGGAAPDQADAHDHRAEQQEDPRHHHHDLAEAHPADLFQLDLVVSFIRKGLLVGRFPVLLALHAALLSSEVPRDREAELRPALAAADIDIAPVPLDHRAGDVKPQAGACAVAAAGGVALIKPVKDMLLHLPGDLAAGVDDVELELAVFLLQIDGDGAAGGGELDGVVHQIIHRLKKAVVLRLEGEGLGQIQLQPDLFFLELLLKADDDPADHLAGIKDRPLLPAAFQPGHGQQAVCQAGEPLHLVGNDAQVIFLLFRLDGAVQNAVYKAGDGGHGGAEIVGDAGDQAPAGLLRVLHGLRHAVEADGHVIKLVLPAGQPCPGGKIPLGEAAGGEGDLLQGADGAARHQNGGQQRQQQDDQRHQNKDPGEVEKQLLRGLGGDAGEHHAQNRAVLLHRPAHDIVDLRQKAVEIGALGVAPLPQNRLQRGGGKLKAVVQLAVAAVAGGDEEQVSLPAAHQNGAVAVLGDHVHGDPVAGVELILPVVAALQLKIGGGALQGPVCRVGELGLLFLQSEAVHLVDKGAAQNAEAQADHQGIDHKIADKKAVQRRSPSPAQSERT